ncbi:hypothetical protein BD779DRAFT_1477169 [Infundibulicybe gibba]|nr:hypothetical protein BD779DRAFT_1477169 [Infundibulicybe gibba]
MSELQRVKHKLDKTLESLPGISAPFSSLEAWSKTCYAACADPRKLKGKGKGLSAGDEDDAVKSEGGDEESKDDDEENEENEDDKVEDEKVTKTHQPSHSMGHPQRAKGTPTLSAIDSSAKIKRPKTLGGSRLEPGVWPAETANIDEPACELLGASNPSYISLFKS